MPKTMTIEELSDKVADATERLAYKAGVISDFFNDYVSLDRDGDSELPDPNQLSQFMFLIDSMNSVAKELTLATYYYSDKVEQAMDDQED